MAQDADSPDWHGLQGAGGGGQHPCPGAPAHHSLGQGRSGGEGGQASTSRRSNARELEAALAMWAPDGQESVHGQGEYSGREGLREFIGGLLDALPDAHFEIVSTTTEGERCGVQWKLTGTFAGPGSSTAWHPPATR